VRALVLALLVALAAAAPAVAAPSRLHVVRGDHARIADARGRQVLLRGVDVNGLGDYFQVDPKLRPTLPLRDRDFARISALGMDVVRLIVHWSRLEPHRGAFDRAYVRRIRRAVRQARRHHLYVVLDMHQDAWGKAVATPPGTACPPGLQAAQGWDGAPRWATLFGAATTCRGPVREAAPAVEEAWRAFYEDRQGIQTELVRTWGRLARAFAADSTIAGYDLLNEPGFASGLSLAGPIGAYYTRALRRIRAAEDAVHGGFHHIAFVEPDVTWSGLGTGTPPTGGFARDRQIVFSPHLYAGSIALAPVPIAQGFDSAATGAAAYRTTVWSGEWGWFGDPATDAPKIAEYARQEDAHRWGGAWWQWKQACGDPHEFAGPGGPPAAISPSLNRYACPSGRALGIPPATRRILSRPYVRAASGRLDRLASHPATRRLTASGTRRRGGSCRLVVWTPRHGRPRFDTHHIRRLRTRRVPGGWRTTGCARGRWRIRTRTAA
jgi:endoglycosylceramidase